MPPIKSKAIETAPIPQSATEFTFTLLAPYNEEARLLGSWDNWQEHAMEKGDDHIFRVTMMLPEGTHRYRFRVVSRSWFFPGEWREMADPWARDIQHSATVAGGEERDCAVIIVKDGAIFYPGDRYEWQHEADTQLAQNSELVIYEMNIGDFTGGEGDPRKGGGGRYADVATKLDYLVDLGITAVELMPVEETVSDYWGYLPRYFYAPESRYGNPDDLKQLIDACHMRGLRVILDKVANHASSECPLAHIDHDYWFHHDNADDFQYGPKFNYEAYDEEMQQYPARSYVLGSLQHWTEEYHVDGIRFDATRILNNWDFLRDANDAVWNKVRGIKPFITIAEHLPINPNIVEHDGPMDAAWYVTFTHQMKATLTGQPADGRDPANWEGIMEALDPRRAGFTSAQHIVRYLNSHDEERLIHYIHAMGFEGEDALRRIRLGATLLITGYGFPMLYAGEEWGADLERVIGENKIPWAQLESPEGSGLHAHYRALIALRREHDALRSDTLDFIHEEPERTVVAYHRWTDGGDNVIVLANISGEDRGGVEIPAWPEDGDWHDALTGDTIAATGGKLDTTLGPWQSRVFVKAGA